MPRESYVKLLDHQFIKRWSPRAFLDKSLSKDQIEAIFEAARWSPSCYNEQPWLIRYAHTPDSIRKFLPILTEANQKWAKNAPLLACIFSRKKFSSNQRINPWAQFDSGAAWMSIALQAQTLGLSAHAMAGFDSEKASKYLDVSPTEYDPIACFAIGYHGDISRLPEELKPKEAPSSRNQLSAMAIPIE